MATIALINVEKQMLLTCILFTILINFWVIPPIKMLPNITFACSQSESFTAENILVKN